MSFFIRTVPYSESEGALRGYYDKDLQELGVASNTTRSFSLRPELWEAWQGLVKAIRRQMRLRDYELTTFAAAREMGCTFCMLAHGAVLSKNSVSAGQLEAMGRDFHHAGLDEKEVVMMDYAQKVVRDASSTTQDDFDKLRAAGWSDVDILNITVGRGRAILCQQGLRRPVGRRRSDLQAAGRRNPSRADRHAAVCGLSRSEEVPCLSITTSVRYHTSATLSSRRPTASSTAKS